MKAKGVKSKVLSGLKWNTISVLATKGTDFAVKLILARLLLPDAFGLVGMAMLVINFLSVVSDMGLFNALVQKKEDEFTEMRYSSAFWYLLVLASIFVGCFVFFLSPLGASFYNEPRLIPVLNGLSLYLFFNILNIIPRVILTRRLDFRNLVRITYMGSAISSVSAVIAALLGFGVWSLVLKSVLGALIISISYWIRVGWRPKFLFKAKLLTELSGYSFYTQATAVLFYFRNNIDYLVIGKCVNAHVLGIYTLAFTLSEVLRSNLYSIFNKVLFPVYSKIQDDIGQIREYYLKVMRVMSMITFPISILFIGMADEIILQFYGTRWIDAAVPLRILSIASMIFAISGTPSEVLKSLGKPSAGFSLNIFTTFFVALPLIYYGQKYFGLAGIGIAVCIHYLISRVTFHHYMKKFINVTNRDVAIALKDPVMAAAVMLGVICSFKFFKLPLLQHILFAGISGILAYIIVLWKDVKKSLQMIKKAVWKKTSFSFFALLQKKSFIIHSRTRIYKMFTLRGLACKRAEWKGNLLACESDFWKKEALRVRSGIIYLSMSRAEPLWPQQAGTAEQLLENKLQQAAFFPRQPVHDAYDLQHLRRLETKGLNLCLIEEAVQILRQVYLPRTSAHGDLHLGNMVCLEQNLKIIDWSMFAAEGSFVTDFIHFYNYKEAKLNGVSWTRSILKELPCLHLLADRFHVSPHHLRLAYSIARMWGETSQWNKTRDIPLKQIDKYNYVLNQILYELRRATVQCSDPVIQ